MTTSLYSVLRTGNEIIDRNLDAIKVALDSLTNASSSVTLTVLMMGPTLVRHMLGRPAHWQIVDQDGPGGIFRDVLPAGESANNSIMFVPDLTGTTYTIMFT